VNKLNLKTLLLIIIFATLFSSCYKRNELNKKYNIDDGNQIEVLEYEKKNLFDKNWFLEIYVLDNFLSNKECGNNEQIKVANQVWQIIIKEKDLSEIQSGTFYFKSNKNNYCGYIYFRDGKDSWSRY
jgi:hypothetical protein